MNSEQSTLLQGQADHQTSAFKSLGEYAKKRIEAILIKCAGCKQLLYGRSCDENRKVCPLCNYHLQMSTSERLQMLFPEGGFYELNSTIKTADPLHFIDRGESYRSKVDAVRAKT